MTTLIEVLDTAIKIGLGALITGFGSVYLFTKKETSERRKELADEKRELVKKLAVGLEDIESHTNEVVVHLHCNDYVSAKKAMIPVSKQIYTSRAYANILGEESMIVALNEMAKITENLYINIVNEFSQDANFDGIIENLDRLKLSMYPAIRKLYSAANA